MVFLDANLVIYLVEQPAAFGPMVRARVTTVLAGGEHLAISDLVRMECQVGPWKRNNLVLLAQYVTFFQSPAVNVLAISPAVCDRAARIRAQHGFTPLDSIHLATAVEHRCTAFLTSDARLKRFPDVLVEIL